MTKGKFNAQEKWGESLFAGFQIIPDVLIKNQRRLSLNSSELVVLLNLTMHWWTKDRLPYPQINIVAQRMGITARTVVRNLDSLEKKGLIKKLKASETGDGVQYDLSGLVEELGVYARLDTRYKPPINKESFVNRALTDTPL